MLLRSKKYLFLSLSSAFIAFLPNMLSTSIGNSLVSKVISDMTSSKCYLSGTFSYFKPQTLTELKLIYDHLECKFNDVSIEHITKMFFGKKHALVKVSSFSVSQRNFYNSIQKKTADLSPKIPIKPWGIYCDLVLNQGTFFDEKENPVISHIQGKIFYSSQNPIDITLDGVCGEDGFIKMQGKAELKSQNIDSILTLKNCPSSVIPDSFLKPLIAETFDLNLNFKGSVDYGHASYEFSSRDLSLNGQFDIQDKHLLIKQMNKLVIKRTSAYVYKDLEVRNLAGQITLNSLDVKLSKIPEIKSVFCSYEGSTGAISYQGNLSGPFKITGDLSQENDDVLMGASLVQNTTELLKLGASYSISEAMLKKGFVKAANIPLIFPIKWQNFSLGNSINFEANFFENQGKVTGAANLSSPHIKSLQSLFSFDKTAFVINDLQALYDDSLNSCQLDISNLTSNFQDLSKISGKLRALLTNYDGIDKKFLPLDTSVEITGLDYVKSSLFSPNLKLQGVGYFNQDTKEFILKDTWEGQLSFDPQTSNLKFSKSKISGKIALPSGSKLTDLPINITLEPFYLNSVKDILVKEATLQALVKPLSSDLSVHSKAIFSQKEAQEGFFEAEIGIANHKLDNANITLKNPPLEAFSGINADINKVANLLGKNLVLDFTLKSGGQSIDVNASSENLKIQGALGYKDQISLIKPIKGSLHIKTLDLPFINTNLPFRLKKPFDIGIEVKALNIPFFNASLQDLAINGSFNILNVSLEQNKKMLQMDAFNATFSKAKGSSPINVKVDADVFSSYDKTVTSGILDASLMINGLSGYLADLQTSSASINASLNLEHFPTLALDFLQTKANLPFSSTFGETLNAKFEMNHTPEQGNFKILASGKETVLKLSATGKNGIYNLVDDVIFQTRLSKELSSFLFASKPLGIEKLTSDYPLVCRISSNASQFTLFPFRTEMLNISSCMFDFGRVTLDSSKILPQTLNLLKSSHRGDNLSVWFQPIRTSIKNGLMNISRFDFLVQDAFQMALWGDVDFNQKQVGLTLGLTASCLQKAFGISELPKTYVMQIPVYGSFDDVKIDSKKATSKIAKILALQHGGSLLEQFGGKSGGAIGGILKELSKIPDGDKKAPDPQTPFPWEQTSSKTSAKASEKPESKKAIRSSDSPVKQLMKVFF
jgi:hypothetical protein